MSNGRNQARIAAIGLAIALGVGFVPAIAGAAAAAPTPAVAAAITGPAWAFGGQESSNGTITAGGLTITWSASFGLVGIFNATNTSNSTIELTEQRVTALSVSASGSGPNGSFAYSLKALEVDRAYANLTRDASVTLGNGSSVAALGLSNAAAFSNASLAESFVGHHGNASSSGYLNVSARAALHAAFSPALGLLPTDLTNFTGHWSSTAQLNASSAWSIAFNWSRHGALGNFSSGANHSGGWNGTASVTVVGALGPMETFEDHRGRLQVFLDLSGPFGLRDGFVLVPVDFDLFGGGALPYSGEEIGAAAISSSSVFVAPGHVFASSVDAAQATFGTSGIPMAVSSSGSTGPAVAPASAPGSTVTAQPESPGQAHAQAVCLETGCGGAGAALGPAGLAALVVIVAAAALGAVLYVRRIRPRSPTTAPSGTAPPAVFGTGAPSSGTTNVPSEPGSPPA